MADKKISGNSVDIVWTDGEQLVANKLNAYSAILSRVSSELEKAVGDVWGESHPYSDISDTKLTLDYGRRLDDAGSLPGAQDSYLDIANIARLIGPASALNPIELSNYGPEDSPAYETEIADEQLDTSGSERREFWLNYRPSNTTSATFTGSPDPTPNFTTQVASHDLVNATGEYCLTADGRLTVFDAIPTSDIVYVTYTTKPVEYGAGPAVQGSTYNVIPDPNQAATGSGCTATAVDDYYAISLPFATHGKINQAESNTQLDDNDASYLQQLYLPVVLQENFVTGDTIPEGFIYLRNNETGKVYSDATYVYNNAQSFYIKNVELDTTGKYTTFTVGSTITENIHDIRWKLNNHTHDGSYGEPPIHVSNIAGILENDPDKGQYVESQMPGNWMPQYLHRDGYDASESNINDNNAMRGHLVLGLVDEEGNPGDYVSGGFPLNHNSYGLFLGGRPTGANPHTYGPAILQENGMLKMYSSNETTSLSYENDGSGTIVLDSFKDIRLEAGPMRFSGSSTRTLDLTKGYGGDSNATISIGAADEINVYAGGAIHQMTMSSFDIKALGSSDITVTGDDQIKLISTGDNHTTDYDTKSESILIEAQHQDQYRGGDIKLRTGTNGVNGIGKIQLCTNWNQTADLTTSNAGNKVGVKILGKDSNNYGENERPLLFVRGKVENSPTNPPAALVWFKLDEPDDSTNRSDVLYLSMHPASDNTRYAEWMQFRHSGKVTQERGGVRMVTEVNTGDVDTDDILVLMKDDGSASSGENFSIYHWGTGDVDMTTSVQFYSNGKAADFGEWVECGNPEEWADLLKIEDLDSHLKERSLGPKSTRLLGLPEGTIVYVRDSVSFEKDKKGFGQFYKEGPGLPLVVTRRALVVGNNPGDYQKEDGRAGEILSFIGQLPVYIVGRYNLGDLIVPSERFPNFGKAVSPEEISMGDYVKALGTVLSDSPEEITDTVISRALVAIGKK